MGIEKKHDLQQQSFNEIYIKSDVDGLLNFLNWYIDKSNELSNSWIYDEFIVSNIKHIINLLFTKHHINSSTIKTQKYLWHLIDKYSELNDTHEAALDRAEDNWWYWVDWRIKAEAEMIEKQLNSYWLDNKWELLRSIDSLRENIKESVKSNL